MDAKNIEEELAKSGSETARVLHLETKRGRTLPELSIFGSVVFDREAAELERQAIAEAKEQLAIAKSMTSASQRQRATPAASSQRRPQRMGTQRAALHIPEFVVADAAGDAAQDPADDQSPADEEDELPSSGADEWVVARDGHSGRQVVALDSETRSRS